MKGGQVYLLRSPSAIENKSVTFSANPAEKSVKNLKKAKITILSR